MNESEPETETPTQLFFKNAKKMPWVIDIYIAIQAAMAFNCQKILDLNHVANDIMPRPDRHPDTFIGLEQKGLDLLGLLFECKCVHRGPTDYHEYMFTRKSDNKSVIGTVKI